MAKRLLIVDPVATNRIRLAAALSDAAYDVETIEALEDYQPSDAETDLVILGTQAVHPSEAISELRTRVRALEAVPILCIDGDASPARRLRALRAGAREVLSRNFSIAYLLARLRSLLRECDAVRECERRRVAAASFGFAEAASEFQPAFRIGCISGAGDSAKLASELDAVLPHMVVGLEPQDVLRDDSGSTPDGYVISSKDSAHLEALLPELRERSHLRHAAVLVLYPEGMHDVATAALNLGASDIAADSSGSEELSLRVRAMLNRKHLQDKLRSSDEQSYRAAATDPLTGLYNRRYAEAYLADTLMSSRQTGQKFVMMLADIDHFKAVNDTHGHGVGDKVLCAVADRLRGNLRACDLISRHGGEEFLVVMPETGEDEAGRTAERLRTAMSALPVVLPDGSRIPITISIGVAGGVAPAEVERVLTGTFDAPEIAPLSVFQSVLEAADEALYRAKSFGRNRVEFSAA